MKYVFKNLKSLFWANKFIAFLLLLIEFSSIIVILFAFGAFGNFSVSKQMERDVLDELPISISFYGEDQPRTNPEEANGSITVDQMHMLLNGLSVQSKSAFAGFSFRVEYPEKYFFEDITIGPEVPYASSLYLSPDLFIALEYYPEEDDYGLVQTFTENVALSSGRYFDNEEYMNGEYCIVLPSSSDPQYLGKTIEFLGNDYEVIGISGMSGSVEIRVPFDTLSGDLTISVLNIDMEKSITSAAYDEIGRLLNDITGGRQILPESATVDFYEVNYYNTVILVSVTIAAVASVNLAILYMYILSIRRKKLGIMMLCGCSKLRAILICNGEILLVSTVIYLICAAVYQLFIIRLVTPYFEYIGGIYTLTNYLIIYLCYIIAVIVFVNIAVSISLSKPLIRLLTERGK